MTAATNRAAWVDAGWLIEHTGGGCEALTRYYLHPDGTTITVVLTSDLAVPDSPTDEWIDPLGVYRDDGTDPGQYESAWGWWVRDEHRRTETTYEGWRRLADALAAIEGATVDVTHPATDPYRGAGLAPDLTTAPHHR